MTDKTIHFIVGLPRSGSTLLCNLLNQNPRFWATPTDGVLEILLAVRNQFENVVMFKAAPNPRGKEEIMKSMLPAYAQSFEQDVLFLKNRGWPAYIEMAEFCLGRKVKMLCTVRTIVDCISSFEKLYRKYAHIWQFPQEKNNIYKWQTVEDRANLWMNAEQPIGIAYNRIRDVMTRGYGDRLFFVDFDDLTQKPVTTMEQVYDFLEEDFFEHDYNNIKQSTFEDDLEHGIPGLHDILPRITPKFSDAKEILGDEIVKKYGNAQFWR